MGKQRPGIMIRPSDAEKRRIQKAAAADSRSVSQWCLLAVLDRLEKENLKAEVAARIGALP